MEILFGYLLGAATLFLIYSLVFAFFKKIAKFETCTTTERAFLNELREKGEWDEDSENIFVIQKNKYYERLIVGSLNQSDFETPLKELVNE